MEANNKTTIYTNKFSTNQSASQTNNQPKKQTKQKLLMSQNVTHVS